MKLRRSPGLSSGLGVRAKKSGRSHDFMSVRHSTFTQSMATTLGKRKRRDEVTKSVASAASKSKVIPEPESDNEDLQAIFRRAFEAKFKPLQGAKKKEPEQVVAEVVQEDEDDDSDWSGISEAEKEDAIEIIELKSFERAADKADKQQMKAFMVFHN